MWVAEIAISLVLLAAGLASGDPLVGGEKQIEKKQTAQIAEKLLQTASSKQLQVPQFGSYGNAQCDSDGNLFFRLDSEGYSGSLVMKLSPSSETPTLFRLPAEFASKVAFLEFSVTPQGSVAFLDESTDGHFVFRFDDGGKMKEQIQLETPKYLAPSHFGMAENGAMFLSGYFDDDAPEALRGQGYAALFEASGNLRKELQGSGENVEPKSSGKELPSGDVAVSADGSFYFLRSHDVLVVSQSGNLRRVGFTNLDPEQTATNIGVSGGLISVTLRKRTADNRLTWNSLVIDDSTGEVFGYYAIPKEVGNKSVCFSRSDGYLFQTAQDGKVKLVTVPLR